MFRLGVGQRGQGPQFPSLKRWSSRQARLAQAPEVTPAKNTSSIPYFCLLVTIPPVCSHAALRGRWERVPAS